MENQHRELHKEGWEERFETGLSVMSFGPLSNSQKSFILNFIRSELAEQRKEILDCLPEERTQMNLPFENSPDIYGNARMEAYKKGYNTCRSQFLANLKKKGLDV